MSVKVMAAVFEQSQSKGSARLVLLAMANEAHSDGSLTAYKRSQAHLARLTNLDVETIRRAIRSLSELGELQVLVAGVGRESSDYRILLPGIGEIPQSESPQTEGSDPSGSPPRPLLVGGQPPQDAGSIIPFSPGPSPVSPVGRSQAKRKSQLSTDFRLNGDDIDYALTKMPTNAVNSEFERFQNYHWGHGTVMLDWRRAWRTWAGNFGKFDPKPARKRSQDLTDAEFRALVDALPEVGS